jgi:hypothetical protein
MSSTVDLALLKIGDFSPYLDIDFDLQAPGGTVVLRLVEAAPAGESGRDGGAFSLLFIGAAGPWLQQAIYPVRHPALGTREIFVVPVGPARGGNGYQAVFT